MWMGLSGGDNVPGTALLVCLDSQRAHPKRTPLRLDNAHFSWWVNQWGTSASGFCHWFPQGLHGVFPTRRPGPIALPPSFAIDSSYEVVFVSINLAGAPPKPRLLLLTGVSLPSVAARRVNPPGSRTFPSSQGHGMGP